jgi:hypothetical protein
MLLLCLGGIRAIVRGKPGVDGGRGLSGHFDLAQRNAECSAAEPVVRQRERGRPVPRADAFKHPALHVQEFHLAEPREQFLE